MQRSGPTSPAPGPVFQLAEKTDSKPVQCGFESHPGYRPKSQLRGIKPPFTSYNAEGRRFSVVPLRAAECGQMQPPVDARWMRIQAQTGSEDASATCEASSLARSGAPRVPSDTRRRRYLHAVPRTRAFDFVAHPVTVSICSDTRPLGRSRWDQVESASGTGHSPRSSPPHERRRAAGARPFAGPRPPLSSSARPAASRALTPGAVLLSVVVVRHGSSSLMLDSVPFGPQRVPGIVRGLLPARPLWRVRRRG